MDATTSEAKGVPFYRSGWVVLLAVLVFPPLGLILFLLRPRPGILLKSLGTLAIAILAIAHLFLFYGLRVEMSGTGITPIFSFHTPESDMQALEKQRAQQAAAAPPPAAPAAAPAALPVTPVSTAEAAAAKAPGKADSAEPAATLSPRRTAYWTDFRGPNRDGAFTETAVLREWPAGGLKPLWKQPIGGGYASFVVAEDRAFTIEQRRDKEVVAAYDVKTGRELWTHSWQAEFRESMGGDGPRATPTWHDGRIYALGATGELRCLDAANGQQLWRVNILEDNGAENLQWGMAAAPLVVDDKVIVLPGGTGGKSVAAYDRLSGRAVWKALDDKAAYASPMLVQLTGQRQLLVVSAERVMGVTVEEGRLLWSYPWTTQFDVNAAQPIVVDANHVFYSSGYGSGAMLLRVTREADEWKVERLWKNVEMKNRFSSSVLRDGFIYGLDEGILVCLEARSGTRKWKSGRYGHGQLLLAGDRLLLLSEQGDLVLLDATPERHAELARVPAIEGKTWNNPALAGGILLVRNAREMAAFRIAAE